MRSLSILRSVAIAIAMALGASAAHADRVVVKGDTLQGTVKSITKTEIVMETVYGEGEIVIAVEDVESIETEAPFHVMHGADVRTVGPVVGLTPDAIRIAEAGAADPVELSFDQVYTARRDPGPEANLLERAPIELPYWSGDLELAFSATQATDDTLALATGLRLSRERGPHRSRTGVTYRLAQQKLNGQSQDTTNNEVRGFLRHEYDFAPRWFAFGAADAEYDEIERLSIRAVPKAGIGYKVYESEAAWFNVDVGGAYVYERFFGGDTNQYPGLALGAESDWDLPILGANWHNRVDYTPSLIDFIDDYLLRFETAVSIPMWEAISLRVSLVNLYDSTPAEGTDENNLSTLIGLSYGF
jgi:putative salt-induced outer membrane protein YdiY